MTQIKMIQDFSTEAEIDSSRKCTRENVVFDFFELHYTRKINIH